MGWIAETIAEARHTFANGLTTGFNLLFLILGLEIGNHAGWLVALSLVGVTSFIAWLANHRRYRLVADTPTSRIISAPQGYTEFAGRGRYLHGAQLVSHLSNLPCLWYRYRVERRSNEDNWEFIDSGASHDTFALDDGSGQILIDPDGAEIRTNHKREWVEQGYRKTEWMLLADEPLYGIGGHVTLGGANAVLDAKQDVSDLLAQWKQDKATLMSRFDLNKDGDLDAHEWEAAVLLAKQHIAAEHQEIRMKDGVHMLRKPGDGRLYLVANEPPDKLATRYRLWSWIHLTIMSGAVARLIWLGAN
ncbi:hypothetical protein SFMTTN_3098 [Sulfuriferula multivorans]|uniref:EF-hand domain-containing protein n=1 Tax=Sulfuriferula multivorans TaxID=1559896 RepID=A0A401K0V9_9PROT|nr:E3 ubiquitin ligase family protein [Sulfuriferula multivorans]GCB02275.1 hypothetical protein SFMTTN_3098 [Sulfuriferula multivorans]